MHLGLGLNVIRSYKRLAYKEWYALAEFVDNSTQSYFDHREALDAAYIETGDGLEVSIVYDAAEGVLSITDNAMGMSESDLERALCVGTPPEDTSGRSQYGMGLKTAACWFGDKWTIRTKKLGETVERTVTVDVEAVANGADDLPTTVREGRDPSDHYTRLEITELHRRMHGKTLGKIREHLRSMYRQDFRDGVLTLRWKGESLTWDDSDDKFLRAKDGSTYKKDFEIELGDKRVSGWIGVLAHGSRRLAGFAILKAGRVITLDWRPESVFGREAPNDLVNQRLQGEIYLDGYLVSHTKDDVLWFGDEEQQVEQALAEECRVYRDVARRPYKSTDDERGPSQVDVQTALEEFEAEISSAEMVDAVQIEVIPPVELVGAAMRPLTDAAGRTEPAFTTSIGDIAVLGFLVYDASPNDPYVAVESTREDTVQVVINMQHPHVGQLEGAAGVLNYLRQCTYDAIAEWQARHRAGRVDPETIKLLKDQLLRLAVRIEFAQSTIDDDGYDAVAEATDVLGV